MSAAGPAIRLAFTQAASRWATGLFAALASMAEVFAGPIAMLGGLAWLQGRERTPGIALLAAVLALLTARILGAFVHGGAIRQSAAWLEGRATGSTLEEMFEAAPRSLGWFLWTLPIELAGVLWKWLGLAVVLYGYGHALVTGRGGFSASVAFALFVCLALPLALFWAALRRAALVAAVRDNLGPFAAAARALTWLAARPGAYLAVLVTGLAGIALAQAVLSVFGNVVSPDSFAGIEVSLANQLGMGVLVAFVSALFELVVLYGFTALESAPAPTPIAPVPDLPPPAATAL